MSGNHKRYFKYIDTLVFFMPRFIASPLLALFKDTGGGISMIVRYLCVKKLARKCGTNIAIFPKCELKHIEKLSLGSNISIHPMCYIEAIGGITIGNDVSIAHSSSLVSINHTWSNPHLPIKYNSYAPNPIVINDDVWVGCGCRILAGVEIGKRSVIAAGAVVNKNVEGNSLYAGVPAKKIKSL